MNTVDHLLMLAVPVADMPRAKAFYADTLGLKVDKDFRQSDDRWWVSVSFPSGGASLTLTTFSPGVAPGGLTLWIATKDIAASHQAMKEKGATINDIKDDLYGPGSGVKWFDFKDPDGNQVHIVQS